MNSGVANAHNPNLRIWKPCKKPISGCKGIISQLVCAGVYVDRHDLAAVSRLDLWAHLLIVDFPASAGVIFFAVSWLPRWHDASPR